MMAVLRCVLVGVLFLCCQEVLGETQAGDTLLFKNVTVSNHTIITLEDIGTTASNALQCQTTAVDCCTDNDTHTGDWYFPNGTTVSTTGEIYQVKGPGYVYLQRSRARVEGIYYCEIGPYSNRTFYYVGLYSIGNGAPVISSEIHFSILTALSVATPIFTLNCTSTGGPATAVNWISPVGAGSESQKAIIDMETASYSNILTVTGREAGNYQCNISNARGTATQLLTVEAASQPNDIRAEQDGSAVTVTWAPPSTTPTGYIIYYQTGDDVQGSVMVNSGNTSQHVIYGIHADRVYYITIVSLSVHLPSAASVSVMAFRKEPYMVLNDNIILNNSHVFYSDIGRTAETGLRCVTRRIDCCSGGTVEGSDETIAEWFNPRHEERYHPAFTRSRTGEGEEFGYANLYKRNYLHFEGIYHCIIPKSGSDIIPATVKFYVGIYSTGGGSLTIPYPMHFSVVLAPDSTTPIFTLTCTSTGGPATTVRWTLNDSVIAEDSSHVFSQIIINAQTAVYNNTLTVTGRGKQGKYQCTVANTISSSSALLTGTVPSSPDFMSPSSTVDTNSVLVQWSPVESGDVPLLEYELSYVRASGTSDQVRCEFEHSGATVVSSRATEHTITGLEEYSTYTISIAAVNVFGTSQPSNQQITTSSSAPTGAPQGLWPVAATDTTITIQWGPVDCTEQNSHITQYVVKYVHGPTDSSAGNSVSTITVDGTPQGGGVYVIVGLSLGVQYFIQVAAMNNNGETGPFSDPIIAETITHQCHSNAGALVGVGVGCSLCVTLLYTTVLGIIVILWKKQRNTEKDRTQSQPGQQLIHYTIRTIFTCCDSMLLRPYHLLLATLTVLLVAAPTHQQDANVTIDVSRAYRDTINIVLPPVSVLVRGPQGCRTNPDTMYQCTLEMSSTNGTYKPTTRNQSCVCDNDIELNISFDHGLNGACKNYIFNHPLDEMLNFSCDPIVVNSMTGEVRAPPSGDITWLKFFNETHLNNFLIADPPLSFPPGSELKGGKYALPNDFSIIPSEVRESNISITHNKLTITNAGWESLGFYIPVVRDGSNYFRLQPFTVFLSPVLLDNRDDRNFSAVLGSGFDGLSCHVQSFPPSTVVWITKRKGEDSIVDGQDMREVLQPEAGHISIEDVEDSEPRQLSLTINGRIILTDLRYEDALVYQCNATNAASGELVTWTRILRVRDPLRPLWPSLGIIGVTICMSLFIAGGHFYEKWKAGKETTSSTSSDSVPISASNRTYSVTSNSNSDGDSPTSEQRYRSHSGVRRIDSGVKPLLQESTTL